MDQRETRVFEIGTPELGAITQKKTGEYNDYRFSLKTFIWFLEDPS